MVLITSIDIREVALMVLRSSGVSCGCTCGRFIAPYFAPLTLSRVVSKKGSISVVLSRTATLPIFYVSLLELSSEYPETLRHDDCLPILRPDGSSAGPQLSNSDSICYSYTFGD